MRNLLPASSLAIRHSITAFGLNSSRSRSQPLLTIKCSSFSVNRKLANRHFNVNVFAGGER